MNLRAEEFIRRFLLHVLPRGFHRIRHHGLLASGARSDNLARVSEHLAVPSPPPAPRVAPKPDDRWPPCPCCGGHMLVLGTVDPPARSRPPPWAACSPGVVRRDPAR